MNCRLPYILTIPGISLSFMKRDCIAITHGSCARFNKNGVIKYHLLPPEKVNPLTYSRLPTRTKTSYASSSSTNYGRFCLIMILNYLNTLFVNIKYILSSLTKNNIPSVTLHNCKKYSTFIIKKITVNSTSQVLLLIPH